jgi:hypothetical protein
MPCYSWLNHLVDCDLEARSAPSLLTSLTLFYIHPSLQRALKPIPEEF